MKVFRPYRDVRFAKDKTPYKTHQGAFVAAGPRDRLVRRDLGPRHPGRCRFYEGGGPRLAAIREGMAHERHRPELEAILADLVAARASRSAASS